MSNTIHFPWLSDEAVDLYEDKDNELPEDQPKGAFDFPWLSDEIVEMPSDPGEEEREKEERRQQRMKYCNTWQVKRLLHSGGWKSYQAHCHVRGCPHCEARKAEKYYLRVLRHRDAHGFVAMLKGPREMLDKITKENGLKRDSYTRIPQGEGMDEYMIITDELKSKLISEGLSEDHIIDNWDIKSDREWWRELVHNIPKGRNVSGTLGKRDANAGLEQDQKVEEEHYDEIDSPGSTDDSELLEAQDKQEMPQEEQEEPVVIRYARPWFSGGLDPVARNYALDRIEAFTFNPTTPKELKEALDKSYDLFTSFYRNKYKEIHGELPHIFFAYTSEKVIPSQINWTEESQKERPDLWPEHFKTCPEG